MSDQNLIDAAGQAVAGGSAGDLIGNKTIENNARQIIQVANKPQDEYDEVVNIIRSGGSWMDSHSGSSIASSLETLPSRAEFAARTGNARIIIETSNNIDAQIASLLRQKDFLVNAQGQKLVSEQSGAQPESQEGDEPPVKTFEEVVTEKVSAAAATALVAAGYTTVTDIEDADDDELKGINGIGDATFDKLRVAFPKTAVV